MGAFVAYKFYTYRKKQYICSTNLNIQGTK